MMGLVSTSGNVRASVLLTKSIPSQLQEQACVFRGGLKTKLPSLVDDFYSDDIFASAEYIVAEKAKWGDLRSEKEIKRRYTAASIERLIGQESGSKFTFSMHALDDRGVVSSFNMSPLMLLI